MKKLMLLLLVLVTESLFSQNLEKIIPLKIDENTDCIEIIDENKNLLNLLVVDNSNTKLICTNKEFEIIDTLITARPDKKYGSLLGYSIDNKIYYLYWRSKNKGEFGCQIFDFNTRTTSFKTINFESDNDYYIYSFLKDGVFTLISGKIESNILYVKKFKGLEIERHVIDLTGKVFFSFEGKRISLFELLTEFKSIQKLSLVQRIASDSPPSLVLAAMPKKIYVDGDIVKLTFDNFDTGTQVIDINLKDYSFSQKLISQPYFPKPESIDYYSHPTSSLYFNNHYIQLKSSPSELFISIKDNEGEEIKSYRIEKDKEVPFRTSDIIQENGSLKETRILSKSNQLLRKISNLNPAVSLYNSSGNITMTIGGVSETLPNMYLYLPIYGVGGAVLAVSFMRFPNENLNSYINRKVVYTSSKFDENFNPINEYSQKTGFDKMRIFTADKKIQNPTLFTFDKTLYLGGIIKGEIGYSIYSFKD
ncbi:MAG: hypothetical protein RLZZ500_160 [Bacteroidota bacterium]|jgi:hypothetical protein